MISRTSNLKEILTNNINKMNHIVLCLILGFGLCGEAQAQTIKLEHNIYISTGWLSIFDDGHLSHGLTLWAGYGLNCYISERFSVMPGVAVREEIEGGLGEYDDFAGVADFDDRFTFIDLPVVAQLHLGSGHNKWVAGLGPVFSFCVSNCTYHTNSDPNSPLNGKDRIKDFSMELKPSVMYEVGKFRFGVEGLIGLLDIKRSYPQTSGSIHLHSIMATVGFHF